MGMRYEWATSGDYAGIATPDELDELAEDGNEDGDYGIAFVTGSDGCMIYGSLEDLTSTARRILADLERAQTAARLEYLRGEIHAERISQSEVIELQNLAPYIEDGDVELLEWAGVSEHAEETRCRNGAHFPGCGHRPGYW